MRPFLRLVVPLFLVTAWVHAANVMDTFAGGGSNSADGAVGTDIDLFFIEGIAVDSATGDVYYSEFRNVVRKVDPTGTVNTVAGIMGTFNLGGSGNALTTPMGEPCGLCIGTVGGTKYLFIADRAFHVIRALDIAGGTIDIIAGDGLFRGFLDGSPGTAGRFDTPIGLAFNNATQVLYIADQANHSVRALDLSTGFATSVLSTVAGNGTAGNADGTAGNASVDGQLNNPAGVGIDSTGNLLYIADTYNNRIRQLNVGTSTLSTVAGSGTVGFEGDTFGPLDPAVRMNLPLEVRLDASDNLLICDTSNDRVRTVDAAITTIDTLYGGGFALDGLGDGDLPTNAQFFHPIAIAVDTATGTAYVADQFHERIRRIAPSVPPDVNAPPAQTATDGVFYTFTASASGTTGITFSYTGLPAWLSISGTFNETISGTPGPGDVSGTPVNITLNATNKIGDVDATPPVLALTVKAATPVITSPATKTGTVGTPLTYTISATGTPTISYSIVGTLPAGLSLVGNTISGTPLPAAVGTTNVTLVATNGATPASGMQPLAITIFGLPPDLSNAAVATGKAGLPFSYQLTSNGTPPFTFMTSTLPPGLSLVADTITGVPTTPGDTVVTVTAQNSAGIATSTLIISIQLPSLKVSISPAKNPAKVGDAVTFTATTDAPAGTILSFLWNYGDGTAGDVGNPVSHAFASEGLFRVSLTVVGLTTTSYAEIVFETLAPNSGAEGIRNVDDGGPFVNNPDDGTLVRVAASDGGVIELEISTDSLIRDTFDVQTAFGDIPGRASVVPGKRPVHKFVDPGIYIADIVVTNPGTNTVRGRVRKTIAISRAETGQAPLITATPAQRALKPLALQGKVSFTKNSADTMSFSGSFTLPSGFDPADQTMSISIGNVVDVVKIDQKGRGLTAGTFGRIKKLQVKYPKQKRAPKGKPAPAPATEASIAFTFATPDLDSQGFDTEGITPLAGGGKTVDRAMQVAVIFAGVTYQAYAPVKFTLSNDASSGTLLNRGSK